MRQSLVVSALLLVMQVLLGCSKAAPAPAPPVVPAVVPVAAIVAPAGLTAEQGAADLLEKKDAGSLKNLLAVNGKDGRQIARMGGSTPWPRKMDHIGELDLVHDARLVTCQGKEYIVAVCTMLVPRPIEMAKFGPIKADRAFVFTPEGKLTTTFGAGDIESDVTVLSLGAEDMWFVLIKKNINEPDRMESDVYLLNSPALPAVRLRYPVNGTGFTANAEQAKAMHSVLVFNGNTPTDRRNLPTEGMNLAKNGRPQMYAIGRDGKEYPRTIEWDPKQQMFRGAGRLMRGADVVYEVNEASSDKFEALDVGK